VDGALAIPQGNLLGGARILSKNDLWIAATTKAASAVLVTTDKDFLCLHPEPCAVHYIDPVIPKKPDPLA